MTSINKKTATILVAATSLCACAHNVIFVTKTSIALDGDTTSPASLSVGYDRVVGYVAPRYPDGTVPPVIASLQGNLSIATPQVSQLYATGQAALNLASATGTQPTTCPVKALTINTGDSTQNKKIMAFVTSTTFGLKLGFSTSSGESITLGYKRKEASVIPVGVATSGTTETDSYPSVLAGINLNVKGSDASSATVGIDDFFATGSAADCLSLDSNVRDNFSAVANSGTKPATPNTTNGTPQLTR
jgi:hypothetical protein